MFCWSQILIWSHPKLECIRSYRFPVMNKKPWCQDVILTSTGVFSVCHGIVSRFQFCGILTAAWISSISHWDQRGTKIHPKKPAFLRPIKSFIFLKYMPRLHLLPSSISKFYGGEPPDPPANQEGDHTPLGLAPTQGHASGMSSLHLLPKILHLLKNFLRTLHFIPIC